MSVAEGVSQKDAINSVLDLWDPVKHPRGRDGKFIETGGFVQVFDGPDGPQIASGKVTAAYKAPDGRTFVGIDVGGGKIVWHRPKQIESVEVKGWLGPKPKSVLNGGKPDTPLPSVPEKYEEIHWADEPDYDPNALTDAAIENDAAWSPMVSKLAPWLTEQGYDPLVNDVYSETTDNYSLIHVSDAEGHTTYDLSNNKSYVDKSSDSEELWAKVQLGIAELLHAADQPGGIPDTEKTGIELIGDVPWKHPDDWPVWLASVGLTPDMTSVYQSEGNPEQLLVSDGIEAAIYKKGHLLDDIPVDTAMWAIEYGSGTSAYTKIYDPVESAIKETADWKNMPGPENPYWPEMLAEKGLPPDAQIFTINDAFYVVDPGTDFGWQYDGQTGKITGGKAGLEELGEAAMDGEALVVWPPLEGIDPPVSDFAEVETPPEGWDGWLKTRSIDSDSPIWVSQTGSIFVQPPGNTTLQQYLSLDALEPSDSSKLPVDFSISMVQDGDWKQVWPFGDLPDVPVDNSAVADWLDQLGVHGASVYQVPEQTGVYIVLPGFEGSDQPGTAWWSPDGILADSVEVAAITAIEVENYYGIDLVYSPPAAPADDFADWLSGAGLSSQSDIYKIVPVGDLQDDGSFWVVEPGAMPVRYDALGNHMSDETAGVPVSGEKLKWLADKGTMAHVYGPTAPDSLMEWEKELMGEAPEPTPADPKAYGPVLHIPANHVLEPGSVLYAHPQGATIIAQPDGTVTKFTAAGKKAATSATAAKLMNGHGAWTQIGVVDSNFKVVMFTDAGPKHASYDPAIGAYTLAPGGVSQKELNEDPDLYVEPPATPPAPPAPLASPEPAPAAPAGPPPIKLPKGKTAFDVLWMIATSHANKNPGDIAAQTGFQNELATVLSLSTGYDVAVKKLNALMTIAKLGGKQRARYKTLLQMHFGVTPAPGSSEQSALPGDPGKWQPVKPPNGYVTGVTNFVVGNNLIKTGGATAGTAKANIQENLSKRLAGRVTMEQMVAAVKDSEFNSSNQLVELTDKAASWKPSDGGYLSKGGHLGIWKWSPHSSNVMGSIPASKENFERAMRESLTSQLVQMWAGTSNDSNPRSLAMQVAAQVEFGLKDTYEWPSDQVKTKKEYDKHGPLFRQFLRVMYENTQDWGKANGVKYVKLKRGMSWGANKAQTGVGVDHDVQLRPMSSFTSNSSTADGFSGGYVIEAVVPIEWIIGNAATGFGCQSEYEWVILGGRHKMRRVK